MFKYQLAEVNPQIGLVNGLAWTEVGGVTLEVEVNVLKGICEDRYLLYKVNSGQV